MKSVLKIPLPTHRASIARKPLQTTLSLVTLICLGGTPLLAQPVREWDAPAPGDGNFGTAANWDPASVPTTGDRAVFDLGSAFEVTLDVTGGDIHSMAVDSGEVTFDLNNNNFGLTSTSTGTGSRGLEVAASASGQTAEMTLEGGATLSLTTLSLGAESNSNGKLTVQGAGTILDADDSGFDEFQVAGSGVGEFIVRDGAVVNIGRIMVGRQGSGSGIVRIDGPGTQVNLSARANIAHRGSGLIEVTNGAILSGRRVDFEARSASSPGTMIVDNATAEFDQVFEFSRNTGTATLNVINGGTFDLSATFNASVATTATSVVLVTGQNANNEASLFKATNANFGGEFSTDREAPSTLTVSDGGEVEVGNLLRLFSEATLNIDNGTVQTGNMTTVDGALLSLTLNTGVFTPAITVGDFFSGGDVTFDNLTFDLELASGFTADLFDEFEVVRYFGDLTGGFAGLTEGDILVVDGWEFELRYGSSIEPFSSSITLTVIPEPGMMVLLAAGGLFFVCFRRHPRPLG